MRGAKAAVQWLTAQKRLSASLPNNTETTRSPGPGGELGLGIWELTVDLQIGCDIEVAEPSEALEFAH